MYFNYFHRYCKYCVIFTITIDETRIHHYTPESREGSTQWVKPGENAPKRPKTQQSAGKVMASVKGKEGGLLEHIMLHYWINWFSKSGRNGHI